MCWKLLPMCWKLLPHTTALMCWKLLPHSTAFFMTSLTQTAGHCHVFATSKHQFSTNRTRNERKSDVCLLHYSIPIAFAGTTTVFPLICLRQWSWSAWHYEHLNCSQSGSHRRPFYFSESQQWIHITVSEAANSIFLLGLPAASMASCICWLLPWLSVSAGTASCFHS